MTGKWTPPTDNTHSCSGKSARRAYIGQGQGQVSLCGGQSGQSGQSCLGGEGGLGEHEGGQWTALSPNSNSYLMNLTAKQDWLVVRVVSLVKEEVFRKYQCQVDINAI